jgi:glycosyltransferase involved in cell wall biosynthesis
MRIGLFTDTYRPSINGIVFVVESLKKHLEAEGHEVYIFCPARSIRPNQQTILHDEDEYTIRFPSIKGAFYDNYDTSFFFPPYVLSKIKDLDLDVIHFFTPGQVGMMGVYASFKTHTPLVAQHCTDLRQYAEHYHDALLLPGLLALISLLPFVVKMDGKDIRELVKMYRPRRDSVNWNVQIVEHAVTLVYSKCDAVIALSNKSKAQLESWQVDENYQYDVTLMPNGVDRLPPPTAAQLKEFRENWNIGEEDEVFGFVGRLGAEKNLDMLIPTLEFVADVRPNARLLFVGDFDHREALEAAACDSRYPSRITFTGALPRESLGVAYAAMNVFTFPSMTDTQGWVLHEAALAGLPIVLIDKEVSEVVMPGVSGEYVSDSPEDMARAIIDLLSDPKKLTEYGAAGQKIALNFTEERQISKLAQLYARLIQERRDS